MAKTKIPIEAIIWLQEEQSKPWIVRKYLRMKRRLKEYLYKLLKDDSNG